jgi:hypothetical protein
MAATKRKPMLILEDVKEDAEQRRMFVEYREENAKDMEREAKGEW